MIAQESLPFTCYQWQPQCDVSRWLVAHRVWELQIKEVSKRLTAFSFRCASEADEDAQSALKVQQKISQAQSTPTENNIFDFSHKAIFLFPKKTFQWFLLRIWNKGRIFFFFTLQIQLHWSWGRNQSQAWLHVFQHRWSLTLHLHHCFPYRDITAVWLPTFSPHLQQLMSQSHGEIF